MRFSVLLRNKSSGYGAAIYFDLGCFSLFAAAHDFSPVRSLWSLSIILDCPTKASKRSGNSDLLSVHSDWMCGRYMQDNQIVLVSHIVAQSALPSVLIDFEFEWGSPTESNTPCTNMVAAIDL